MAHSLGSDGRPEMGATTSAYAQEFLRNNALAFSATKMLLIFLLSFLVFPSEQIPHVQSPGRTSSSFSYDDDDGHVCSFCCALCVQPIPPGVRIFFV